MSLNQPVLQSKTHLNKSKTIIQKKKKTDNPGIRILNMGQNKGLQDNSEENARVLTCQATGLEGSQDRSDLGQGGSG